MAFVLFLEPTEKHSTLKRSGPTAAAASDESDTYSIQKAQPQGQRCSLDLSFRLSDGFGTASVSCPQACPSSSLGVQCQVCYPRSCPS